MVPSRILVSGGGGRDAYPVLHASLEALARIRAGRRPEMTLIAGPLMEPEMRLPLAKRAEQLGAWFLERTSDMPALLDAADLLVTMGGYNSVTEAIAARCPTVVIPRIGPSAEQRLRAECLERLGFVETVSLEALDPGTLTRLFRQRSRPRKTEMELPLNGAARAAALIAERLSAARRGALKEKRRAHA